MKIRIKNEKRGYVEVQCGRLVRLNRGQSAQVTPEADKDGNLTGPASLLHAIEVGDVIVTEWADFKKPVAPAAEVEAAPEVAEKPKTPRKPKPVAPAAEAEAAPALPGIPETPDEEEA